MLIYHATKETRMPAMDAYMNNVGEVVINGSLVEESGVVLRMVAAESLRDIRGKDAEQCTCDQCGEIRERRARIVAAINLGHGR